MSEGFGTDFVRFAVIGEIGENSRISEGIEMCGKGGKVFISP